MAIANLTRMSVETLAVRIAAAKRIEREAKADIAALTEQIMARGLVAGQSIETTDATVTLSKSYERTDLDSALIKATFTDWQDRFAKVTTIRESVRVTFH